MIYSLGQFQAALCRRCYDRENGEMINDLIITDEKGVEKAVIPDEAWLLSSSIVMTIGDEDYYIRGCNDASNFSVKKYKCSDLLAGVVDPDVLFDSVTPAAEALTATLEDIQIELVDHLGVLQQLDIIFRIDGAVLGALPS